MLVERFNKEANLAISIDQYDTHEELEVFYVWPKKKLNDESVFIIKLKSIFLDGKMKQIQIQGLGEIKIH